MEREAFQPPKCGKGKRGELFLGAFCAFCTWLSYIQPQHWKKLANGVPIRYHSLSFIEPEAQTKFEQCLESARTGEVITLAGPPDIINVELFPDFEDDDDKTHKKNKENCKKWKDRSITNDGTVVVPISISNKKHVKWKRATVRGRGGSRFFPSRVLLADYFPIEPGFSITIHKAQVCVCILYIIKIQICPI